MAALAIAEALGDGPAQAMILSRLAIMEANHLQLAEAVAHAHRAIEQARALDDARALDRALDSLLVASMMLGDVPTGDRVGGLLVERLRARGDLWYLQFALTQWGSARLAAGHWDDALARFRESLQISRRIGDRANEPMFLTQECWAWRTRGDYRRALAVGHQALELARGLEHREWIAWSAAHLGWTLEEIAAVGEAAGRFEQGLAAARRAGSAFHVLNLTGHLAWAAWLTGDPARAAALAEEAEAMAGRATVPPGQAVLDAAGAYLGIARVRLATGDPASAERLIRPVLAAAEAGWVDVAARAGLVLAACRRALGDPAGAAQAAERARAAAAATGLPAVLWQAHAELAVLAEAGGRADEAAAHRRAAEPVVERLAATLDPGPVREAYARAALDALREGRCLPGAPAG
jgi:tetratricopeptide (TPR) repeat protein